MISVVIPVRRNGSAETTLRSLAAQTVSYEIVVVQDDEMRGAPWARNTGARLATGDYLLFSDDDIQWRPGALAWLLRALDSNPSASYSFGSYEMGGKQHCKQPFSLSDLRTSNIVSTMSLIRRDHFPGFDESLERFQDWDLWLAMAEEGHVGVHCGRIIFSTVVRDGLTFENGDNRDNYERSRAAVVAKHGL